MREVTELEGEDEDAERKPDWGLSWEVEGGMEDPYMYLGNRLFDCYNLAGPGTRFESRHMATIFLPHKNYWRATA